MVAHSKVVLSKACTSIILSTIVKKRRARRAAKTRTIWVREWIKNRSKLGPFHALQKELEDQESFRIYLRMDEALKHVDKSRSHPGKHDASCQRCFNVGLSSLTSDRH